MSHSAPPRPAARRLRSPAPPSASPVPTVGITVYGCGDDEALLVRELAPRFGAMPTITAAAVSEATVELASGNRCISVGHKSPISNATLRALRRAGVRYLSTRSIGDNHIDVRCAERLGLAVEPVAYSPGSVADYTLMLILMALRHARSVLRRVEVHDYRLPDARGRELRDLTVGVIGTGRIGAAVLERLRGFGCRTLAYDAHPTATAEYVSLGELLARSDVVTLHTPLTASTHHLLDGDRIEQLKHGAFVVNTARGAVLDTEALARALERGRLGGAALDVLEEADEGLFYADCRDRPIDSELLQRLHRLPNVIVSPHIAFDTDHALSDMVQASIANCVTFARSDRHG